MSDSLWEQLTRLQNQLDAQEARAKYDAEPLAFEAIADLTAVAQGQAKPAATQTFLLVLLLGTLAVGGLLIWLVD